MRVFAGQERLKAPGEAPSRYRSSTTDSIVFIIFTIAAIEHKLSSSSMSSSTVNTEHQFSVPRGFFELLLLLIAASEICAVCCLCLLNREHTHRGGIHLDNLYVFGGIISGSSSIYFEINMSKLEKIKFENSNTMP